MPELASDESGSCNDDQDISMENSERITGLSATELARVLDLFAPAPQGGPTGSEPLELLRASAARHALQPAVHCGAPSAALRRMFVDTTLPAVGSDFADYARLVAEPVVRHSINMGSPRSFGHMTGTPPAFIQSLADIVCGLNQNLVKADASRVLTLLERQTFAVLHRLVYRRDPTFYDEHVQNADSALGIACSGGTLANLTAMWCARNSCFPPGAGFDGVEEAGMAAALRHYDAAGAVILGSERMHYSLQKAGAMLGLGRAGVVTVDVDEHQRIDLRALVKAIDACRRRHLRIVALVGVAGSTDCGSVDPLDELAAIATRENIHFHVDAAWGASLLFSRRRRLLAGIEAADSVAFDAHKQLYVPIGAGVLLLRDPSMAKMIQMGAPYMLHAGSGDQGRFAVDGSRPGSALLMHASLQVIGRQGFALLLQRNSENAAQLATLVAESMDFELLHASQTNIILYRYIPASLRRAVLNHELESHQQDYLNQLNLSLQQKQSEEGASYVSRTTMSSLATYRDKPIVALRAVLLNPLTGFGDINAMLADQRRIAAALLQASTGFR